MKIAIAQCKPTIGDLNGNLKIIQHNILMSIQNECDVVVFPELVTTGYPPRDLLYSDWFWEQHEVVISEIESFIHRQNRNITAIVGGLHQQQETYGRWSRYNAAFVISKNKTYIVHKRLLPCYDVFDETRYFKPDLDQPCVPIPIRCEKSGGYYNVECDVLICEDIWNNEFKSDISGQSKLFPASYGIDPVSQLKADGPLFIINGSPYWHGKVSITKELIENITKRINRPVIWCNAIGCYDDIILGGYSMISIPQSPDNSFFSGEKNYSTVTRVGRFCQEELMIANLHDKYSLHHQLDASYPEASLNKNWGIDAFSRTGQAIEQSDLELHFDLEALVFATREYLTLNGFSKAVFGASGGIDSALVGAIAALAIGGQNVTAVSMPSQYSSQGSISDAMELAKAWNMQYESIPISDIHEAMRKSMLSGSKQKFYHGVTDENIQARARGMILAAHSNDDPQEIILSTGNKSEISVGYCTLYGDMAGGYAVIADVFKTLVWDLSKFINKYYGSMIPVNSIEKPPSAELRPDQKDTDSLPTYDRLDKYLTWIVEEEMTVDEIGAYCHANNIRIDLVELKKVWKLYRNAEYKRKQLPPSPKVSKRSFGSGRRWPITMKLTSP